MYKLRSLVTVLGAVFCAGVLLLIPATVHAQQCFPAPEGLVAWWDGDAVSGTTVVDIQNDNNGTLVNGAITTAAGKVGQAFTFDGVDDYIDFTSAVVPLGPKTIDLWIKTTSTTLIEEIYGNEGADSSKFGSRIARNSGGGFSFTVRKGVEGQDNLQVRSTEIDDGYWHHIAATWDGTTNTGGLKVYVDGLAAIIVVDTFPTQTETVPSSFNLRIGATSGPTGIGRFFNGDMDEIEVFDRALSEDEIWAIFEADAAGKCKDEDGDGFRPPQDCDEGDSFVNPNAIELPGNFVDENCDGSLGDVDPCAEWQNHGKYVRAVAHAVNDLVDAGLIAEEEGDALVSSAAMSKIGKTGFVPPECD